MWGTCIHSYYPPEVLHDYIANTVTYSLHIALLVDFLLQYAWEQSDGHPVKEVVRSSVHALLCKYVHSQVTDSLITLSRLAVKYLLC